MVGGPGGVLLGIDYQGNKITIAEPNDPSGANFVVYDIYPWRAPATGGHPFVVSGSNFGTVLGNVNLTIGGVNAPLTSVSNTRIFGTIPAHATAPATTVDVIVTVNSQTRPLTQSFRYLQPAGSEPWGWRLASNVPVALGEVAGGIINSKLYLVGEGNSNTYEYDIATDVWSTKAMRPNAGNHHAAVVNNNKLYLFGGLGSSSEGKVQIYDPSSNSWSLGTSMPWNAGSCNAAFINGLVYVCGGIIGSITVDTVAAYDPVANTWSAPLAVMPMGRNHAAASTDGIKLYVFGGRDGGNFVTNGFDDTQIYDPATDTWQTSAGGGSLAPLPLARGGTGAAVYFNGEFYVMGGETLTGSGATVNKVYDRVDIYDPANNTWRIGSPMPTARHGIFPLLNGSQIYVPAGGVVAANSQSKVMEIYAP